LFLLSARDLRRSASNRAKIPGFLLVRSYENLEALGAVTLAMALLVIPGTLLGRRLLKHTSEQRFVRLYRLALLAAGLKVLVADGLYALLSGP
jgi:uncharacterized membrane protein YfcA